MRFFLDNASGKNLEGDDEFKYQVTNCYIEFEYKLQDESFIVVYLIPKDNHSVLIATCWDTTFDDVLENLDDKDYLETVYETWPDIVQLIANGIKDKYSEGALIKLEDFDTGDHKWFLASVAGNLDFEDIESITGERTQETIGLVLKKSIEVFQELTEKKPSAISQIAKGFRRGFFDTLGSLLLDVVVGSFTDTTPQRQVVSQDFEDFLTQTGHGR